MPYNALGDLYKIEVVKRLQKMGCNVKSVHALNLILEKMGILIHSGDHWLTSKNGVKYTIYSSQVSVSYTHLDVYKRQYQRYLHRQNLSKAHPLTSLKKDWHY